MGPPLLPPRRLALPLLVLGAGLALGAALLWGSVTLDLFQWLAAWGELAHGGDSLASTILSLRLPRALTGMAVGGLLGLCGALLQALLRNPLADPYVLGVSGGASTAAMGAIALGAGALAVAASAAAGALVALGVLFLLAHRALFARDAGLDAGRDTAILLTGVMVAALCSAAIGLVLALAPDGQLRSMVFWLMGDLSGATRLDLAALSILVWLGVLAVAWRDARALHVMQAGDLLAFTQGVPTAAVRRRLIAVTALGTGVAVALSGAVGFVGFMAPHLARHVVGAHPRAALPAASLVGAILVLLADTAGRSVAAPLQLPVGALTALVGVPVFLWQLQRP